MGERVRASYEAVAKALIANGVKCYISYPGKVQVKDKSERLNPVSLDCFDLRSFSNLVSIFNFLKENDIGIIFYIDPFRQWLAAAYFKLLNIKTIYYCRYGYPPNFTPQLPKQIWKWLYHRLHLWSHYIAISHHIKSCFIDRELIQPKKISIVRNGLDPTKFVCDSSLKKPQELQNLPADAIIVLSVAQIRPEKRIDNFLKIASIAIKNNIESNIYFFHIGDGPILEDFRAQLRILGLADKVFFLGKKLNVKEFMQHSDILLHTSEKEGICNVIGEAMLMELPVVASFIGGNEEQIQHQVTGYLNPVDNPDGFAEAIQVLASDKDLRKRMGATGRRKIINEFSIGNQVSGLIDCIKELNPD